MSAVQADTAVGIEADPRWFDVAVRRVSEAVESASDDRDLFSPLEGLPEALAQ